MPKPVCAVCGSSRHVEKDHAHGGGFRGWLCHKHNVELAHYERRRDAPKPGMAWGPSVKADAWAPEYLAKHPPTCLIVIMAS